jgi:hypothetical protein
MPKLKLYDYLIIENLCLEFTQARGLDIALRSVNVYVLLLYTWKNTYAMERISVRDIKFSQSS